MAANGTSNDQPTQDFEAIGTKGASDLGNNTTISGSTGTGAGTNQQLQQDAQRAGAGAQLDQQETPGYSSSGGQPQQGASGERSAMGADWQQGQQNQQAGGAMNRQQDQGGAGQGMAGGRQQEQSDTSGQTGRLNDEDVEFEADMGDGGSESSAGGSSI